MLASFKALRFCERNIPVEFVIFSAFVPSSAISELPTCRRQSMENPEEVLQLLERFTKLKQKEIPRELDDYLGFVARTGDTVYRWAIVKHLFREKLVHVITDFHDNTPSIAGKWVGVLFCFCWSLITSGCRSSAVSECGPVQLRADETDPAGPVGRVQLGSVHGSADLRAVD